MERKEFYLRNVLSPENLQKRIRRILETQGFVKKAGRRTEGTYTYGDSGEDDKRIIVDTGYSIRGAYGNVWAVVKSSEGLVNELVSDLLERFRDCSKECALNKLEEDMIFG